VVDNFSLLVSHSLMLLAAVRLLFMPELDHEPSSRTDRTSPADKSKARRDA
jgi:hypothetical protein